MPHRIPPTLMVLAAVLVLGGASCQRKVIEHDDASGAGDADDGSDEGFPPPFYDCRQPLTNVSDQSQILCFGLSEAVDIEGVCDACICGTECNDDADCGDAPGGTATPFCDATCVLDCGGGKTCPDGMVCVEDGGVSFCGWPYTDPLQCYVERNIGDDPCSAQPTEQDCLAFTSSNDLLRCDWITRRLFGDGGSSCEPVSETSSCVAVASTEPRPARCNPEAACGVGDRAVYWRDLGAGTAEIIETSVCDWRPELSDLSPCDFTGPTPIPLVCGCACTGDEPATTPAGACTCPS